MMTYNKESFLWLHLTKPPIHHKNLKSIKRFGLGENRLNPVLVFSLRPKDPFSVFVMTAPQMSRKSVVKLNISAGAQEERESQKHSCEGATHCKDRMATKEE